MGFGSPGSSPPNSASHDKETPISKLQRNDNVQSSIHHAPSKTSQMEDGVRTAMILWIACRVSQRHASNALGLCVHRVLEPSNT